jgi:diaminohydroxyphosphoribosylaminopyrimidine deaminase/5-amino-6-(5-phosphoribosylamino)uracil reductase
VSAFDRTDEAFMREALRLAERARGSTRPNPVVGAIVTQRGQVLSRGFHRRAGLPHAEIEALKKLAMRADGATLYVTLEPCCHVGRTGPCTESILRAGVARVVVGCKDDNPLVHGRGIARLRRAGIRVEVGCLEEACRRANRSFFTWVRDKRPWVTLKVAATLDGYIGDRHERERVGEARWITGQQAREVARRLRAEHDAVLVGVGTVLADDPRLTVRASSGRGPLHSPRRVVLDSQLRTPPDAKLLRADPARPPLLLAGVSTRPNRTFALRRRALEAAGAEVLLIERDVTGRIDLRAALSVLAEREIQSVLVEGGSRVHGALVAAGLVDSVAVFLAPRLIGAGVPIAEGLGLDWRHPTRLGSMATQRLGDDILLTADVVSLGQPRRS